jgi:site-specific DNA recombinase
MNTQNKHVAIGYLRVSTDDQADNGISLDYQEKACREAAKRDGYIDVEIIKDEGKTGTNLNRAGIQKVIQMAKDREIDAVYITNSDRLSRNVINHGILKQTFQKNNVTIKYLNGQSSEDNATSSMVDNMLAAINQYQSDTTKEKTVQAVDNKAKAGYFPTHAPVGYLNVENPDKHCDPLAKRIIVPDPKTGDLVTEAFKLYATGQYNVFHLNDLMHEKGLVSYRGKKLVPSMFYKMLKNRLYLGEIHWRQINVTKGKHIPLIDQATFDAVQKVAKERNGGCRRRKYDWLLNGYIFCEEHKRRYTAEWHLKKSRAYYHCTNRFGCGKYVEKTELERQVADKFKNLEFSKHFTDVLVEYVKKVFESRKNNYLTQVRALQNQKNAFDARIRSVEDRLIDGSLPKGSYERVRNDMEANIAKADSKMNKLKEVKDQNIDVLSEILALTHDIYDTYMKAPESLQKRLIGFFFEGFEVKNGVITKERYSPFFSELLQLKGTVYKHAKSEKSLEIRADSEVIIDSLLGD